MKPSRYEEAGVSIDAQDQAIDKIKSHVKTTETNRVLSGIGSFGGLFDISFPEMTHPVLVSSADGVGTKLKVAFDAERYNTVGQCLVNHCVDDILVQGARPLFFMDYIATGKLKPKVVEDIVGGMAVACRENSMAILGGEMAEMPGFYKDGEFDVAGFIVGVVDRPKLLGAEKVKSGQKLIGLASTGLHTNGYSLARKIIFEEKGLGVNDLFPGTERTVGDVLLAVHRSYYSVLAPLLKEDKICAMAHITGGGFVDNIPRVLPENLDAVIRLKSYPTPPVFQFFLDEGGMDGQEPYRVFNMGIGMVLVVEAEDEEAVLTSLKEQGEQAWAIGEVIPGNCKVILD